MGTTAACHQTVEQPCSYTTMSSSVQSSAEGDFLLQDDIDGLDYIFEDANLDVVRGFPWIITLDTATT